MYTLYTVDCKESWKTYFLWFVENGFNSPVRRVIGELPQEFLLFSEIEH